MWSSACIASPWEALAAGGYRQTSATVTVTVTVEEHRSRTLWRSTPWFRTFDPGVIRESAKESLRTRNTLEWVPLSARFGDSGSVLCDCTGAHSRWSDQPRNATTGETGISSQV